MEAIRIWYNGPQDYKTGVRLYLQFGVDAGLKRMFSSEGYTEFKRQALVSALEAMISEEAPAPEPVAAPLPSRIEAARQDGNPDKSWNQQRDEVEEALYQKWTPLIARRRDLQSRLEYVARQGVVDLAKEQECGRMALEICDLNDQCKAIYAQRNYYRQHGKLPEAKEDAPQICQDPQLWHKSLANHQRYLRDYRQKYNKEGDPDKRLKLAENIRKQEALVNEYKKLLKML